MVVAIALGSSCFPPERYIEFIFRRAAASEERLTRAL